MWFKTNQTIKHLLALVCLLLVNACVLSAQPEALSEDIQAQIAAGKTPVGVIELKKDRYYQSEGRIRDAITPALDAIVFDENNELIVQLHQFGNEPGAVVLDGSPSMTILDKMLRFSQYKRWELVVYDNDPERLAAKIAALKAAAAGKFGERTDGQYEKTQLMIIPYRARTHERVHWDCVSEKTGMYMRALR